MKMLPQTGAGVVTLMIAFEPGNTLDFQVEAVDEMRKRTVFLLGTVALIGALWIISISQRLAERHQPVSDLTFAQVEAACAGGGQSTEAQQQKSIATLRGSRVRWSGEVEDVDANYAVYVDIDGFFYDTWFRLAPEDALQLTKGARITFTGTIDRLEEQWVGCRVFLRSVRLETTQAE